MIREISALNLLEPQSRLRRHQLEEVAEVEEEAEEVKKIPPSMS